MGYQGVADHGLHPLPGRLQHPIGYVQQRVGGEPDCHLRKAALQHIVNGPDQEVEWTKISIIPSTFRNDLQDKKTPPSFKKFI